METMYCYNYFGPYNIPIIFNKMEVKTIQAGLLELSHWFTAAKIS